jgi:hypothetical protein
MTLASGASIFALGALLAVNLRGDDDASTAFVAPAESDAPPANVAARGDAPLGCAHARPEWLWCDDFEADRLSRYFEYVNTDASLARAAGAGRNGSTALRAHWVPGQVDAGSLKMVFGRNPFDARRVMGDPSARYRELYWRVYVRSQPGWRPNGNDKFTRAIVFSGRSWQEAAIGHVWGGGAGDAQNYYVVDPASGVDRRGDVVTTQYNDFAHLTWFGATQGRVPLLGRGAGQWYCVEAHMRLNDSGASNGVLELWVDDSLDAQRGGMNWVGSYTAFGINALFLESYINKGSPQPQVRDYDDLVVSTARIGCAVSSAN